MTTTSQIQWGNPPLGLYNYVVQLGRRTGLIGDAYEIYENLTGQDYTNNLLEQKYDVGLIGTPPFFSAAAAGAHYRIVGNAVYDYPPFDIVVAPEVQSMADLRGGHVAINKTRTCPHSVIRTALRLAGVDEDLVTLDTVVTGPGHLDAIERGEVRGAVLWEPYRTYAIQALGWHELLRGRDVVVPSNYGFVAYASTELIMNRPVAVHEFLSVYHEAVEQARRSDDVEWFAEQFDERVRPYVVPALLEERQSWVAPPQVDWPLLYRVEEELSEQGILPNEFVLEDVVEVGFNRRGMAMSS